MRREGIVLHSPNNLDRPGIKSEITSQDTDAMITMTGKIVERCIYLTEEAGSYQLEFQLFHRPAVKLFRDLDFKTLLVR
jgi:hypothetical protein